jgi:hypothetical protein
VNNPEAELLVLFAWCRASLGDGFFAGNSPRNRCHG